MRKSARRFEKEPNKSLLNEEFKASNENLSWKSQHRCYKLKEILGPEVKYLSIESKEDKRIVNIWENMKRTNICITRVSV